MGRVEAVEVAELPRGSTPRKAPGWLISTTTETVAFGVGKDDVIGVRRSLVPVHLSRAQRLQPLHLPGLVLRVQIEVKAWRDLHRRGNLVERQIRPDSVPRSELDEVVVQSCRT